MTDEVLTPREVLLRLNIEKQKKTIEALRQRIDKLRGTLRNIRTEPTRVSGESVDFWNSAWLCRMRIDADLALSEDDNLAKSRDE